MITITTFLIIFGLYIGVGFGLLYWLVKIRRATLAPFFLKMWWQFIFIYPMFVLIAFLQWLTKPKPIKNEKDENDKSKTVVKKEDANVETDIKNDDTSIVNTPKE